MRKMQNITEERQINRSALGTLIAILLVTVFLTSCGTGKKSGSAKNLSSSPRNSTSIDTRKIDACAVLAAAAPDKLLGEPTEHITKGDINRNDAKATISVCGYSAKNNGLKTINLRLAYVPDSKNPQSAADIYDIEGVKKMGVYTNPQTGEVKGVGDVAAYLADDNSYQLKVFWNNGYEATISLADINNKAKAQSTAVKVARTAIDKL